MYFLPLFFGVQGPDRIVFRWLVLLLGLSIAVLFPGRVLGAYLSGLQRFDLYNLTGITTVVVRAVLVVAVLRLGYGVLGMGAATLGLSVLSLILNWRLVRWADPRMSLAWRHTSWARMRELGSYSFYAFLNALGDHLRFYTDSAVIARLLAIALVTPFSIAARLMDHFKQVVFGFVGPLMPRMSELDGQSKAAELRQLFLQSTRVSALISFFIGSLLLLDGQTLLYLWLGDRFLSSYPILLTLTAGYVATLAQFPSNIIVYAKGRHRPLGWWILSEGAANLLLSIYFGTKYGLLGVALGTAIPMLVTGLVVQPWYALRLVPVSVAEYFREALARPALTCALFLGLGFLAADGKIQTSVAGFILRLVWHGGFFALLAYAIGLAGAERKIISQRSKDFTQLALRMARI
jgi:O-antigen/teichoic acid export membrane protein